MSTRYGILAGAHHSTARVTGWNMMRQTQGQKGPVFPAEERPWSHCPLNHIDFKQCSSLCYLLLGALILLTCWH